AVKEKLDGCPLPFVVGFHHIAHVGRRLAVVEDVSHNGCGSAGSKIYLLYLGPTGRIPVSNKRTIVQYTNVCFCRSIPIDMKSQVKADDGRTSLWIGIPVVATSLSGRQFRIDTITQQDLVVTWGSLFVVVAEAHRDSLYRVVKWRG